MPGGTNGPPILSGAAFSYPTKTLKEIRLDLLKRLGYSAMLNNPPVGINELLNSFINDAHEQLYYRVGMLRRKRWWKIDVTAGNRFYDIPYDGAFLGRNVTINFTSASPDVILRTDGGDFADDGFVDGMDIRIQGSASNDGIVSIATVASGTLTLSSNLTLTTEAEGAAVTLSQVDFTYLETLRVNECWIKDGTAWLPMREGINPAAFTLTNQTIPTTYEIRTYIEIWPEPEQVYELYIIGDEGLRALTVDTDTVSVDPRAVFLMALANAKAHYGHGDARTYYSQLEVHLGKLNAGLHRKDARQIPDRKETEPCALSYPKVTGTGWVR